MSDAIITAIITAVLTLIGVLVNARVQHNATMAELRRQSEISDQSIEAKLDRHQAVTDTKIEELTREVREHNAFAQRIPILEEKAKSADRRLTDLEHKAS